MSDFDKDIRAALNAEERELYDKLDADMTLDGMMLAPFKTRLKRWTIFAFIQAFIFAALAFWCGYEFFTSVKVDDRVFWGCLMLLTALFTAMFKIWFWMEMQRLSVVREIRRVELQLAGAALRADARHSVETP